MHFFVSLQKQVGLPQKMDNAILHSMPLLNDDGDDNNNNNNNNNDYYYYYYY